MRLLFLGDIALSSEQLDQPEWEVPFQKNSDGTTQVLFNWELPMGETPHPVPRSSGPRLIAPPSSEQVIKRWSPGFAACATNHLLDAGDLGLKTTLSALRHAGFQTVGAGIDRAAIEQPLIWRTTEGTLGIINWVFAETHPDWMAVPGVNCWPGLSRAAQMIQSLREVTDWVVLVLHWSDELFAYPPPQDRALAAELAALKVDAVICHHPHVVRGMEWIQSCPIFYSLGNFFFADIPDGNGGWRSRGAPRNREGLGVALSFERGKKVEFELISFWRKKHRVIRDPLRRAQRRLRAVSRPLRHLHAAAYQNWYGRKRHFFDHFGSLYYFGVLRLGFFGSIRRLWQYIDPAAGENQS
ncbi:MAG: CapA family protein [Anaerolineaceae bacterium]|nr:CapA family protein [Anaerolineaceae bacterium]